MLCCFDISTPPGVPRPGESNQYGQPKPTSNDPNLVAVTIPHGMRPGQTLLVKHPMQPSKVTTARIPDRHSAGQVFYVRFPDDADIGVVSAFDAPLSLPQQQSPPAVNNASSPQHGVDDFVSGFGKPTSNNVPNSSRPRSRSAAPNKHKLCSKEMILLNQHGLVNVTVPPGVQAGDKIRVQIPDGRLMDAVVPAGAMTQFQLKVPAKKQNFHDNPIAVHAPMALGPLMMM